MILGWWCALILPGWAQTSGWQRSVGVYTAYNAYDQPVGQGVVVACGSPEVVYAGLEGLLTATRATVYWPSTGDSTTLRAVLDLNAEAGIARVRLAAPHAHQLKPFGKAINKGEPLTQVEVRRRQAVPLTRFFGAGPVQTVGKLTVFGGPADTPAGLFSGCPVLSSQAALVGFVHPVHGVVALSGLTFTPVPGTFELPRTNPAYTQWLFRRCPNDPQLMLLCLEHTADETRAYFAYTSWQLLTAAQQTATGRWPLALSLQDEQTFWLVEVPDSGYKGRPRSWPALSTSLEEAAQARHQVGYGQTHVFRVSFRRPPLTLTTLQLDFGTAGRSTTASTRWGKGWSFGALELPSLLNSTDLPTDTLVYPAELATAQYLLHASYAALQQHEYKAARALAEKHVELNPLDPAGHMAVGVVRALIYPAPISIDSLAPALGAFDRALALDNYRSPHLHYNRAWLLGRMTEPPASTLEAETFSALAFQHPQAPAYRRDAIFAWYRAAQYKTALLHLDTLLQRQQTTWYEYYLRGLIRHKLAQPAEACKDWQRAFELSPNGLIVEQIQEHCSPSTAKANQEYLFYVNAGNRLFGRRDYLGAVSHFQPAIKMRPLDPQAYYLRGKAYYHLYDQKKATLTTSQQLFYLMCASRDLAKALTLPGLSEESISMAYYLKGQMQKHLGNRLDAVSDLLNALNKGHELPEPVVRATYDDLGNLYYDLFDAENACQYWAKAESLGSREAREARERHCKTGTLNRRTPAEATPDPATGTLKHRVQPGDTLESISTRYRIPVDVLRVRNRLASDELTVGTELLIE